MAVQVHETLAGGVKPLQLRDSGRVAMYVCGPTVYNYIHIGNARTFVWFDQIRRYLAYRGLEVTYVVNYTDVDDKIIERANLEGISPDAVSRKYANAFESDMKGLGVRGPDIVVRATDHIEDMVKSIETLVEKGLAYEAGGDVYFAVERFDGYGKLSHRSLDDMRAGQRVEPSEHKENPLDFALWKAAKQGEPSWPSPWGDGRPGWHIECSVMSTKYLGFGFDIHGGASDLIFPHHENEVAQAEGVEGAEPFVRNWMHAGLVQMDEEKMSKSLGNFVMAKDLLEQYEGQVLRYWAIAASYRAQTTFSDSALSDAEQAFDRWSTFHDATRHALGSLPQPAATTRPFDDDPPDDEYVERFVTAMDDDFNSAEAFAAIHDLVRDGNKLLERVQRGEDDAAGELTARAASFLEMTGVLGFDFAARSAGSQLAEGLIDYLLELREEARGEKAFQRADAIRDKLVELGVTIEDTPAGPRWRLGVGGG